jgi:hypothetical protein
MIPFPINRRFTISSVISMIITIPAAETDLDGNIV